MPTKPTFATAKNDFDKTHRNSKTAKCIVPVNGKSRDTAPICDTHGKPSEEYYKWQFVHALINAGLYARDFVGVEVQFPKGNSAVIRLDGAIFDSGDWLEHYNAYWKDRGSADLEWLHEHLLAVIEFKKNDKDIERVFASQVKPAMRSGNRQTPMFSASITVRTAFSSSNAAAGSISATMRARTRKVMTARSVTSRCISLTPTDTFRTSTNY